MANRYLRATGNWNGSVWAATSGGAAGSAATPTADDVVYITANYTVTLNQDAQIQRFIQSSGGINLSSYTLSTGSFDSSSGTRSINLASGRMIVSNQFGSSTATIFDISGGSLTLTAGSSIVEFRGNPNGRTVSLGNNTFNDVFLNFGVWGIDWPQTLNITGSPTFRSLIIQSKNSAAHTVNFDSGATITTNKFVAIGSSSSNKLTVKPSSGSSTIALSSGGSSYGQFVNMQASASGAGVPKYIGANSTQSSGMGWLLQDPPKISTLVDPLTTAHGSNANWAFTGTITDVSSGAGGGGYQLAGGATMVSTDTYDLVDNYLIFENFSGTGKFVTWDFEETLEVGQFYRFSVSDTNDYLLEKSADAYNWTTVRSTAISDYLYYKSSRIIFNGATTVGSVNVIPAPAITGKIINISSIMGISKITL